MLTNGSIRKLTGCSDEIPHIFSMHAEWKQLHALSLGLELGTAGTAISKITEFLQTVRGDLPSLEDVTAHFLVTCRGAIMQLLNSLDKILGFECSQLEDTLLTFPRPKLSFIIMAQAYPRKLTWISGIAFFFPSLGERHALNITCEPGELDLCYGIGVEE